MKKTYILLLAFAAASFAATSCIQETEPQNSYATIDQVAASPNVFDTFVSSTTSSLVGQFYFGSDYRPWDFGLPSFFLQRDVMGQDIALETSDFFSYWYQCSFALGPRYLVCQVPMTYYYRWINGCNTAIELGHGDYNASKKAGLGIAYAMRALFYMDIVQMYGPKAYAVDKSAPTVPIVTELTEEAKLSNNPRATNEEAWAFILADLDSAEVNIKDYVRADVYTPDLSVVYGLKARAYLTIEDFPNAEKYAKLAQDGYSVLTEAEYTDRMTAFNTPVAHDWMFGVAYQSDDPNITANDSDSNWGSQMFSEISYYANSDAACGYANRYGTPKRIDRHLYETIPATDFRKKCFVDFSLDDMSQAGQIAALADYSDYGAWIVTEQISRTTSKKLGGLNLKFRAAGGTAARGTETTNGNLYLACTASVPVMRVEEMLLIEAEAAGMQDEARGKALLEAFAKTRDAVYAYDDTRSFRDNVWWQRRVELWGEGFGALDIKRLNKGITRSYAGTNHPEGYRWNTTEPPQWMTLCFVQTESNYNRGLVNNPTPVPPTEDSPEFVW